MSRMHNVVTIQPARNGFIVEAGSPAVNHAIVSIPYVFESIGTLQAWLEENYTKGKQPEYNGA